MFQMDQSLGSLQVLLLLWVSATAHSSSVMLLASKLRPSEVCSLMCCFSLRRLLGGRCVGLAKNDHCDILEMETRARKRARRGKEAKQLDRSLMIVSALARAVHHAQAAKDRIKANEWQLRSASQLMPYGDPALQHQLERPGAPGLAWTAGGRPGQAGAHLPAISKPGGVPMTWPEYKDLKSAGALPPRAHPAAVRRAWNPEMAEAMAPVVQDAELRLASDYMQYDLYGRTVQPLLQDRIVRYASALSASGRVQGRQTKARAKPRPRPKPKAKPKPKKTTRKRVKK